MICNKIKFYRELKGMSQMELANKFRIERTYLSKLENNKYPPSTKLMEDICVYFNVTLGEMFYIVRE